MPESARRLPGEPLQLADAAPQARRRQRRVSSERPASRPQEPARVGPPQERQQQPAPAKKKKLRSLSQCRSKNRPHRSRRCRLHPKPPSPSKLPKTSKASAHEPRLFPFRQKQAALSLAAAPILGN